MGKFFLKAFVVLLLCFSHLTASVATSFDSRCVKALSVIKEEVPSDIANKKPLYSILDPESDFLCEYSDESDIIKISIPILVDDTKRVIKADVNVRSENINNLIIICNN